MGTYQFSVVHGIKSASDETDSLLKIAPSTRKKKDLPSTTACLQHSCLSMIRKEEKCFRLAVCDKKKKKARPVPTNLLISMGETPAIVKSRLK